MISVYVHFPFCLRKCPYCDFNSYGIAREDVPHRAYADAVLRELDWRLPSVAGRRLVSIFFGGGTPSLWEACELGRVVAAIRGAFSEQEDDLEVSVECNPTSLDRRKAAELRQAGVTRLSVGVQSLDASRLAWLGRLHDGAQALTALTAARAEMERVSADFMFGLPEQTVDATVAELDRVLETGVEHVSAYALTIEPGTRFGELHRKGMLRVASEDAYVDTFLAIRERMTRLGFDHYEVSNYAKPGCEARHNLHYWRGGDYLGLGAGAVGCIEERSSHKARRWRNEPSPERYLRASSDCHVEVESETLEPAARVREAWMLGLRTREGLDLARVRERTGLDPLTGRQAAVERRIARGDLVVRDGTARVPAERWLVLDTIVGDLF